MQPLSVALDGEDLALLARAVASQSSLGWWLAGFWGLVAFGLAAVLLHLHQQSRHTREQYVARLHAQELDPEALKQLLGGEYLPAWLRFPDVARTEWINTALHCLWPHIDRAACSWAWQNLEDLLNSTSFWRPQWLDTSGVRVRDIFLGQVPPTVTGVKVYGHQQHACRDELTLEFDFAWASKMEVKLAMRVSPRKRLPVLGRLLSMLSKAINIKVAVRDVVSRGRLRFTLRPLLNKIPVAGAIKVSFVEAPNLSYQVRVYGGSPLWVPGVEAWINSFIKHEVLRPYIFPEGFVLKLADVPSAGEERPEGLLSVRVVEATSVPRMDLFSHGDPYCKLYVREGFKLQTTVKSNTAHPVWDEEFHMLVHDASRQVLYLSLWDSDVFSPDDKIGSIEVALSSLDQIPGAVNDLWLDLRDTQDRSDPDRSWFPWARKPGKAGASDSEDESGRASRRRGRQQYREGPSQGAAGSMGRQRAQAQRVEEPEALAGLTAARATTGTPSKSRADASGLGRRVQVSGTSSSPASSGGARGGSGAQQQVWDSPRSARSGSTGLGRFSGSPGRALAQQLGEQGQDVLLQLRRAAEAALPLRRPCRLHIQVSYTPFTQQEYKEVVEGTGIRPSLSRMSSRESHMFKVLRGGVLYVHLNQATNLATKKSFLLRGGLTKNMRCRVRVGRHERVTERGRRTNSRNPMFDQTVEVIVDGDTATASGTMVQVEIRDISRIFPSEFKGRVTFPLQTVMERKRVRDVWPLEGVPSGQLDMELEWLGAAAL